MIRQYLNIGKYKYCVEFISYDEEFVTNKVSAKFVMLRNFKIMNDIVVDDNIYFIEKDLFDKYKEALINKKDNDILVFPTNTEGMHYSKSFNNFNDTFLEEDLTKNLLVYNIYEKTINDGKYEFNLKSIKCNTIKIYHPHIKTDNKLIVHIENNINNIHMHYICNTYNNFKYNSYEEFRYENNIYSEFIYCRIPDVKDLFDRIPIKNNEGNIVYDYTTYFKEDLNVLGDASEKNKQFIENTIILLDSNGNTTSSDGNVKSQYVPLALLTQPFIVEESKNEFGDKIFKKLYFKYKFTIETNYITAPINVSLFPYDDIDENSKTYLLKSSLTPGTTSFTEEYRFNLSARCCFGENNVISLITAFDYPDKEFFETYYPGQSFGEAYCFYNHIYNKKIYSMNETGQALVNMYKYELDEIRKLNYVSEDQIKNLIADDPSLLKYYSTSGKTRQEYYLDVLKQKRFENFLEEYIDEYGVNIDFFGFRIIMASDKDLKNIIFEYNYSLLKEYQRNILNENPNGLSTDLFNDIFNNLLKTGIFYFNINGIFSDWSQLPDNVVCRIEFQDRFIGTSIKSNKVVISKEKFKYMTNKSDNYRLDTLTAINNNMKELTLNIEQSPELNEILNQITGNNSEQIKNEIRQFIKDHNHMVNFVNNINCSIKKLDDVKDNLGNNGLSKTQIIYKPIFYKVQTAQLIKLKYQQVQNIGLDLHEYMSKVDMFMLSLDGTVYKEIGRNANYVLFNINALTLSETSGTYQIYNQDSEYITYGAWTVIM